MALTRERYQPSTRMLERTRSQIIRRIKHQVVRALLITKTEARVETQKETIPLVSTVTKKVIHHLDAGGDQMQSAASVISLDMKPGFPIAIFKSRKQMPKLLIKMKKTITLWQRVFNQELFRMLAD